jgi:hypothetical protein
MRERPNSLKRFTELANSNLNKNLDIDSEEDQYPNLKVQLIESNWTNDIPAIENFSQWEQMDDSKHWYVSTDNDKYVVLNKVSERVWALYTMMSIDDFTRIINRWVRNSIKLDKCWLSTNQIEYIGSYMKWEERGIGIKYEDTLSSNRYHSKVSLKAWYGENDLISGMLKDARNVFSTSSIRWKDSSGDTDTSSEWYSNGKITFHASSGMEEIIDCVSEMSKKYNDALEMATKLRNEEKGAFEFDFKQKVNLDNYSDAVGKGKGNLKLWMTEVESYDDFRRFQGVDLHTWDRLFLDLGTDYAYMTIPGNGCVNAAPRLVSVQGETAFGKTKILYNGNEIFV